MAKVGRPTDYKPEYCEQAFKLCLLHNATDVELADFLGVNKSTIENWKNAYPEFLDSIKRGKAQADTDVARSLYDKAINGDTVACIFWLKNRRKQDWRDKQDVNITGDLTIKVDEPDDLAADSDTD